MQELVLNVQKSIEETNCNFSFELYNVAFKVKDRNILFNVKANLPESKMTAILGPSGAGKSTLINIIRGKLYKTSGEILINGENIPLFKYKKLYGYVPQV